jgi:hypothetical protein
VARRGFDGQPGVGEQALEPGGALLVRARSTVLVLRCRTLASAPAAITGGMAVVKMNPGAKLRTQSTRTAGPAMYPPTTPRLWRGFPRRP